MTKPNLPRSSAFRLLLSCCIVSFGILLGSGCDHAPKLTPVDQIKVLRGDGQCALPGEAFDNDLTVECFGPEETGWLGQSSSPTSPHARLRFAPAAGSDLIVEPSEVETGVDGTVSVKVRAGRATGDHYLDIIPVDSPRKSIRVRFTTGMRISGGNQEGTGGALLADPLVVKLVDSDGRPAAGIPVYFSFQDNPEGKKSSAKLIPNEAVTDKNGEAATQVRLGNATGEYRINIEVAGQDADYYVRGTVVKTLALNVVSVVIMVLGGLALFVYGMKLMGDGLQKVAGEKLKKVLHFFSRNCVIAAIAGAGVTAIIQSSSATTVMVIGFINAGLLNLGQAVGIIFGANVGTTITAQIISFKLDALAIPAIVIGLLALFSKRRVVYGWGETVFGFGLLFFGMTMMSDELKILGDFPSFRNFFQTFNCAPAAAGEFMPPWAVLGAIGIGLLMTVIIQSSSAAMGIILALAAGGLINFYTSIPLLLGTNIGTTITAWLASLAANRPSKQAALSHFLFNFIGTAYMVLLFYVPWGKSGDPVFLYFVNATTPGDVFAAEPQNIERHIAMAHTYFNLFNLILLLPFTGLFVRLCNWMIPIKSESEIQTVTLEPRLLNTPSVALEQAVFAIRGMVEDAWAMVRSVTEEQFLAVKVDPVRVQELAEAEEGIDRRQREVTEYLVQITRRQLTEPQSELVPILMHCTNDAERLADHTENIVQLTERLIRIDKKLSHTGMKEIRRLVEELNSQAENVVKALGSTDADNVRFALKSDRKINKLAREFENNHIERLRKSGCSLQASIIYVEMLGELEAVGSNLANIAERTPELQKHYIRMR